MSDTVISIRDVPPLVPGSNAWKRIELWEGLNLRGVGDLMTSAWIPFKTNLGFALWNGVPVVRVGDFLGRNIYADHTGNLVRYSTRSHDFVVLQVHAFNPNQNPTCQLFLVCPQANSKKWHRMWVTLCQLYLQFEAQKMRYEDVSMNCPSVLNFLEVLSCAIHVNQSVAIASCTTIADMTDALLMEPARSGTNLATLFQKYEPPRQRKQKRPGVILGWNFATLIREVTRELLQLLPKARTSMFEQSPTTTGTIYLDMAVHVGNFNNNVDLPGTAQPNRRAGRKVFAALRKEFNAEKSPAMKLYARTSTGTASEWVEWADFNDNIDLREEFKPAERKGKINKAEIKALVKCHLMLAAESNKHKLRNFREHRIPIKRTFRDHMIVICRRLGDIDASAVAHGSDSESDTSDDGEDNFLGGPENTSLNGADDASSASPDNTSPENAQDPTRLNDEENASGERHQYAIQDKDGLFTLPSPGSTGQRVQPDSSIGRRLRAQASTVRFSSTQNSGRQPSSDDAPVRRSMAARKPTRNQVPSTNFQPPSVPVQTRPLHQYPPIPDTSNPASSGIIWPLCLDPITNRPVYKESEMPQVLKEVRGVALKLAEGKISAPEVPLSYVNIMASRRGEIQSRAEVLQEQANIDKDEVELLGTALEKLQLWKGKGKAKEANDG